MVFMEPKWKFTIPAPLYPGNISVQTHLLKYFTALKAFFSSHLCSCQDYREQCCTGWSGWDDSGARSSDKNAKVPSTLPDQRSHEQALSPRISTVIWSILKFHYYLLMLDVMIVTIVVVGIWRLSSAPASAPSLKYPRQDLSGIYTSSEMVGRTEDWGWVEPAVEHWNI